MTYYYTDANGIEHESYRAACIYYGADTPEQLEAEGAYWAEVEESMHYDRLFNEALLYERNVYEYPEAEAIPF